MDFKKKLKTRLYLAISYIIIGIALAVCAYVVKPDNDFLSAFGIALAACGIVRTIKLFKIIKNAERLRRLEIAEKDERNVEIWSKAKAYAFSAYISLCGIAVIVTEIIGMTELALMISYSICILVFLYWICYMIIRKKS